MTEKKSSFTSSNEDGSASTSKPSEITQMLEGLTNLAHQLEPVLDLPVAAQLTATSLQEITNCDLSVVFLYSPDESRLLPIAKSGTESQNIPPGFRMKTQAGLIGQAIRQRKTVTLDESSEVLDFRSYSVKLFSGLAIPIFLHGFLDGLILLGDKRAGVFTQEQIKITEIASSMLLAAWSRDRIRRNLRDLVQTSAKLAQSQGLQNILNHVAASARHLLHAQAAIAITNMDGEKRHASAGQSTELFSSAVRSEKFLEYILALKNSERFRDIRQNEIGEDLRLDTPSLRSVLMVPIRLAGDSTGSIVLFGKHKGASFSDQEVFLAELLSDLASGELESYFLDKELHGNLRTNQLISTLTMHISQAAQLSTAVHAIGEAAMELCQASTCGLILYNPEGAVEMVVHLPEETSYHRKPMQLVEQVRKMHQMAYITLSDTTALVCFPLQTPRRSYGGLWLEMGQTTLNNPRSIRELNNLVRQASLALERTILLKETRAQAEKLSQAVYDLERAYDHTLMSLISALEARDKETEGHCIRVAQLAMAIGESMGLMPDDLKALERGSLLHDIGKMGISDSILLKEGPLDEEEWAIMRQHPAIGARIIAGVPFLKTSSLIVASHQERWDGSGYPFGLKGEGIPMLARIFMVADVFDALISERPYHEKVTPQEALEYLCTQANTLFDPYVVKILVDLFNRPNLMHHLGFKEL